MSDDAQEWRWVGEDGVEKTVSEQDLIAELSSEALPNYTLVWKKGWLEWLPAMQVSELAWSLPPGRSDDPIRPREQEGAAAPPAPPLYRYPVIKRRAANLRSDRPPGARPNPRPPRPPNRKPESTLPGTGPLDPPTMPYTEGLLGGLVAEQKAPEPPPDSAPGSMEEVDIDSLKASDPFAAPNDDAHDSEEEVDEVEDVSAPGRDAPAPLGEPVEAAEPLPYGADDDAVTRVLPSKPPPGFQYVGPHAPPAPERKRAEPPAAAAPVGFAAPLVPKFEQFEPRTVERELEPKTLEPEPVTDRGPPSPPLRAELSRYGDPPAREPKHDRTLLVYGGIGFLAVVIAAFLLFSRGHSDKSDAAASAEPSASAAEVAPKPAPSPAAAETSPAPALGTPCSVATPAAKIADWANPSVMPAFARIPGSSRVAVGLGQSDVYAIGITIDPKTLDRDQVFREYRHKKLVSVVPITSGGKLRFEVSRTDPDFGNARVVDAPAPFFVGTTKAGLARTTGAEDPSLIWAFNDVGETTVPRIVAVADTGYAVTFRTGDKTGKVQMGWLGSKGEKKSKLAELGKDGDFAGTPAIAESEHFVIVTFAAKAPSDPAWGVAIATAKHGELPGSTARFRVPPGGPGGDAISPSAAPLAGGRWLLQWTEGSSGNRAVRAVVLGPDLAVISDPIDLSPRGENAGQAALYATGDLVTALFYVQRDKKSHELWGASLECAR